MKTSKVSFVLMLIVMAIAIASTTICEASSLTSDQETPASLRGTSRVLSHRDGSRYHNPGQYGRMTCDRFPRICHTRGSFGGDCCYKRCVDMKRDRFNCGRCGKRCGYSEICCQGKCVNTMFDTEHCGSCFNMCKKGKYCFYGMCSYA